MSDDAPPKSPLSPNDVKTAYSEAIRMMQYEGSETWQRFNAFLVANGVLAGLIVRFGPVTTGKRLVLAAEGLGFVLCTVWACAFARCTAFFDLRVAQAKQFEPAGWNILREGESLSVIGHTKIGDKFQKMPLLGTVPLRWAGGLIIAGFGALYVFAFVTTAFGG